ncbi:MAG: zinc ABC transporter permease [Zetaproteobacteria bacterium]|nr:MAG: zinc ABC transporter permease [Zetaproteobacteria bacterium]
MSDQFFIIDFPALIIVSLASLLCALLGSFLVLTKQAVIIDAISHSVLPGIVVGVLLSGSFSILYVMAGALTSALIAVMLVYAFQHWGKIEQGAAIGAVFTAMFAFGVLLLETQVGSRIHLDTQHVLYGALELTYWANPFEWSSMPTQIKTLAVLLIITIIYLIAFFKELRLTTFDPTYAKILGYKTYLFQLALLILIALVAVGCFEATGSILVIALFICPAAAARMLCDRMISQLLLSALIAVLCAVGGYLCSALLPIWLGFDMTVNSASVIALFSGICLIASIIGSPKYGILAK